VNLLLDILLTKDGDLNINGWGDITLTESVRQAIRIRLLWFFEEWRFAPELGIPYWEEVFIKNPNIARIRRIVRNEVLSVQEVQDVRNVQISIDNDTRNARITFDAVIDEEIYREEVDIPWGVITV